MEHSVFLFFGDVSDYAICLNNLSNRFPLIWNQEMFFHSHHKTLHFYIEDSFVSTTHVLMEYNSISFPLCILAALAGNNNPTGPFENLPTFPRSAGS